MSKRPAFGQLVLASIGLLALAASLAAMVWYLWRPSHLVWVRNAYGMAQVGAWGGAEGFGALLLYWFFELRGRTVVTALAVVIWGLACWKTLVRPTIGGYQ